MTKQEKAVIYFLIGMLILGLAVKFYKARFRKVDIKVEKSMLKSEKIDLQKIIIENQIVNINKATVEELGRLPGIGHGLAQRIVEYRDKNGSFVIADDLKKVKGIGLKKYEDIKNYISVE